MANISAMEDDPFSVFTDDLSPSYDIKVNRLEYDRENEVNGRRGFFLFTNFNIVNSSTSTQLNSSSGFYDANIYMVNNRFGLVGKNFKFVYKLKPRDFKYLNSIKYSNLLNTHFVMNRDEILIDSEELELREPKTYIKLHNYDVSCKRHQDYLLNDFQGFVAGCSNFGTLLPKDDLAIDFRFKSYNDNEEEVVNFRSAIESVQASEGEVIVNGLNIEGQINKTIKWEAAEFTGKCAKEKDLLTINRKTFIEPCLRNLSVKTPNTKISFLEKSSIMEILDMDLKIKGGLGEMEASQFAFSSLDSTFEIGRFDLNCNILSGNLMGMDNYIASCLTQGNVDTRRSVPVPFHFHQEVNSKRTGDPLDITIKGKMKSLHVKNEKLTLVADKTSFNVSNNFFLNLDKMIVNCQKDPKQLSLDIPLILEHCKKGMFLESRNIDFHIIDDKNESIRGQINTKSLNIINQKLNFDISRLKIVDKESRKVIRSIQGQCGVKKDTDIFDISDVIEGCSSNMNAHIEAQYTDGKSLGQNSLRSSGFDISEYNIRENKPGLSDIQLNIVENQLAASMKVRFLGINFFVEIQGRTNWNKEKQLLILKVNHSRLPLGITSRGLFMYIAKKFMQSDMISFGSNEKILIQL